MALIVGAMNECRVGGSVVLILVALLSVPLSVAAQATREGYVTDAETAAPVVGARIRIVAWGTSASVPAGTILATTESTAEGYFALPTDLTGVLEVERPGFAVTRTRWLPRQESLAHVRLERAAQLVITVRQTSGEPVAAVVSVNTLHPGNLVSRTVFSSSGTVQLDDAASGFTTIVARADGYAPAATTLSLLAGRTHGPIDIVLQQAGSVQGRVVDVTGAPVEGAVIVVRYSSSAEDLPSVLSSFLGGRLTSDVDGRFSVAGGVPGRAVQLYAEYAGRVSDQVVAPVATEGVGDVVLVLR